MSYFCKKPEVCSVHFVPKSLISLCISFCAEEKKVKKYLEDNYQHRTDLITPLPELKNEEQKKYQGVGPKTKEGELFNQKHGRVFSAAAF